MSYQDAFTELVSILDTLRAECPWDKKQTIHTLRNLTIEEVYELVDAIDDENWDNIREELGDVLLHILFYTKLAHEKDHFSLEEMLRKQSAKMIRRHPHIYGDTKVKDEEEVRKNWEQLKMAEGKKSVLSGVPRSLTAMIKAYRMQEKAAQVGFEWEKSSDVWDKVKEELNELEETFENDAPIQRKQEEFGDVLFSLINYARFNGIDPEKALQQVNQKFKNRFEYIEDHADRPLTEMTLEEMDALWNEAKKMKV